MTITQTIELDAAQKNSRSAYQTSKLRMAQRNIHVFIAIASVATFLFLVCDLIYIHDQSERLTVAIVRYAYSILLILMTRVLQNSRTFYIFSVFVTLLETGALLLFLYVLYLYESPHFMIQSMGLISLLLIFFLIPNNKWNMLVLAICGSAAYFIFAWFRFQNLQMNELTAAVSYTALTILLCSVAVFGNDRYIYQEYQTKFRLEQTSTTDFLTNAVTRARLEEEAHRWMSFCRRQGLPLCLVFADVDNLKSINDRFGHAAGDIVLKQLAELMKNQLRNSDTIARWGGDEFVLLLPNVSLKNALLLLDRIKTAVSRMDLNIAVVVTCSYGAVEMDPECTYQQMLDEADRQMYLAKRIGKEKSLQMIADN